MAVAAFATRENFFPRKIINDCYINDYFYSIINVGLVDSRRSTVPRVMANCISCGGPGKTRTGVGGLLVGIRAVAA